MHDGCNLKQEGCRRVSRLLAYVGLPFHDMALIPTDSLGCALSIPFHRLPTTISEDGAGEKLGSSTGRRNRHIVPCCPSPLSFKGAIQELAHPFASLYRASQGALEAFPFAGTLWEGIDPSGVPVG